MSELQYKRWCDYIILIDVFYKDEKNFDFLATFLEPWDEPIPVPLSDNACLKLWYELWGPLEETNAYHLAEGIETRLVDVKEYLEKIRQFFVVNMEKVKAHKDWKE